MNDAISFLSTCLTYRGTKKPLAKPFMVHAALLLSQAIAFASVSLA